MKVANVTLPLMTTILLSGNTVVFAAGASSALDPYNYIQAPTRAEREAQAAKKNKKNNAKVKKVAAAVDPEPRGRSIETVPASVVVNERPRTAAAPKKVVEPIATKPQAETKTALKTTDDGPLSGEGFMDGLKQSTAGIKKSTHAVTASVGSGFAKIGSGFMAAGGKVKDGTMAAGEKMAVVPKKIGEGFKSTGEKVKEGSSSMGEKLAGAGGALMTVPKMIGHGVQKTASKVGDSGEGAKKIVMAPVAGMAALGHGIGKLNPFGGDKDDAPKAVAQKNPAVKADATKDAPAENKKIAAKGPVPAQISEIEKRDAEALKAEAANKEELKPGIADTSSERELTSNERKAAATPTTEEKSGGGFGFGMGTAKKLATAPMAGVNKIGHGFGKLNPFHKDAKEPAPQATASKLPASVAKPAQSLVPEKPADSSETPAAETQTASKVKAVETPADAEEAAAGEIGGRLQPADNNETGTWSAPESTAATPDAIPH